MGSPMRLPAALCLLLHAATALQINIHDPGSRINPLGRPVRVCSVANVPGHLMIDSGLSFNTTDDTPQIFSAALDNLRTIRGFDIDFAMATLATRLGWEFEIHVYATFAAALYRTRSRACDVAVAPF